MDKVNRYIALSRKDVSKVSRSKSMESVARDTKIKS